MKNIIKRVAAWILIGVMLFSLVPMNLTIAREKAAGNTEATAADETSAGDRQTTEEKTDIDEPNLADEKTTEVGVPDSSAVNGGEDVNSTQESTRADIEREDSDASDAAEQDTANKEGTGTVSVEENVQDTSEEQADLKGETSDGDKAMSTEDAFNTLANEDSLAELRKVEGTISVKIDGNPVSPGNQNDPTKVTSTSNVVITFDFKIMNNNNLKVNEHCYYDLPVSGVSIDNRGIIYDRGGNVIGEWMLENDRLEFWFTDEDFLTNNIIGKIDLEGTVNLNDIVFEDDASGKIQIADDFYNINVDKSRLPNEVIAEKTAGSFERRSDEYFVTTYTIKVKALKAAKNVHILDRLGNGESNGQDYAGIDKASLTIVSDRRNDLTDTVNPQDNWNWEKGNFSYYPDYTWKSFDGTIPDMEEGETITITYTVYAHRDLYNNGMKEKANNNLTVTDRFGREVYDESVPFPDYQITVTKSGEYKEEDGTVTWTITVENPDGMDLNGVKITDVSSGYKEGIYEETEVPAGYLSYITINGSKTSYPILVFMQQGYTFMRGSTEKQYIIEYTLMVKDEYKSKLKQTKKDENTVQIISSKNTTVDEAKDEVGIGPANPVLKKSHARVEAGQIEWILTFTVPEGGLADPIIHDEYDDTMTFDKDSVTITGEGSEALKYKVVAASPENADSGKLAFEIQFDGDVPEGKYEISYTTSYGKESDVKEYKNTAKVIVGDEESDPATDSVKMTDGLLKWAVRDNSAGTNQTYYGTTVQNWRLQLKNVKNMNGSSYIIEDTWSSGYEYVEGSLQAHSKSTAASSDETYPIQPQETYNGIKFDVTGAVKYAQEHNWSSLYITYQTRMKEDTAKDFLNSYGGSDTYSIANTAILYEDDYPLYVSPDAKATSRPKAVVAKIGNYDGSTAPYAEYAISVNPGGNDLLKNGDTLVVKDTLPDNFVLVTGSVQVYHATVGTTNRDLTNTTNVGAPLEKDEWSYAQNGQTLIITIPDEMEVIIKYKVIVDERKGTVLNEDNATNRVELSGVDINSNGTSYTLEGQVAESSALARSEMAKLTIYKKDADAGLALKFLSGAEFQVRIVDYNNVTGNVTEPENTPQGYNGARILTTNGDGYCTADKLYFDHLYELLETKAPEGYVMDDTPRYFVFIGHDNIATNEEIEKLYPEGTKTYHVDFGEIHIDNKKKDDRDIYISKKALTGNDELPGAHIILKEDGKVLEEWDTTGAAKKLSGDLFTAGKEYVLTETAAPDGYEVTADIVFTVDESSGAVSFSPANINKDAEIGHYEGTSGDRKNHIIIRDRKEEVTTEEKTTEEKTTEEKTTEEKTTEDKTTTTNSKKTGDDSPIGALAGLMLFSTTAVVFISRRKKKVNR